MKKFFVLLLVAFTGMAVFGACSQEKQNELVLVNGGAFVNTKSGYYGKDITLSDFYIGKYEVTQKEWVDVMGNNPSQFIGENLPVEMVNWYDCIDYCNKRSAKEGLEPYYNIDENQKDPDNKSDVDTIKWTVTVNPGANGYRLPTEPEWEYAACGGQVSKGYTYSGSDTIDQVAWYWRNSGSQYLSGDWTWGAIQNNNDRTKPVGSIQCNELGLYDMSGNVREWCWDWYDNGNTVRVWRGGGWMGEATACEASYRGKFEANGKGPDTGFRVCRNG